MGQTATYDSYRDGLETYFDRTARDAWERLTSDAQVSGIRATVRAGRDKMRNCILDMLPTDMTGLRLLDAGCGTGSLAVEAAMRGAEVVGAVRRPEQAAALASRGFAAIVLGGSESLAELGLTSLAALWLDRQT